MKRVKYWDTLHSLPLSIFQATKKLCQELDEELATIKTREGHRSYHNALHN